ncbi:hypothetical protein HHI36_001403 [Cryptolaemus montrouzieri]|uniref:DUF5641 domain-containing protein n=1 Tax=Cryptolaemus montrouzieri TaxID=559131 RepID=A0ABD2P7K7_9CUCU
MNENTPPLKWPLGVIQEVFPDIQQYPPLGLHDHIAIGITAQLKVFPKQTVAVKRRNFWRADYVKINSHLTNSLNSLEAETIGYKCKGVIDRAVDCFIPERSNAQKTWTTKEIMKGIRKKETSGTYTRGLKSLVIIKHTNDKSIV